MIFIDTNLFLARDNVRDVHHQKAVLIFQEIDQGVYGEPVTSNYIFSEVIGVTFRKEGKLSAVDIGEKIIGSVLQITIEQHLLERAWNFFKETSLSLNLVDCTNVIIIKMLGINYIATFDKEFKKIKEIKVIN